MSNFLVHLPQLDPQRLLNSLVSRHHILQERAGTKSIVLYNCSATTQPACVQAQPQTARLTMWNVERHSLLLIFCAACVEGVFKIEDEVWAQHTEFETHFKTLKNTETDEWARISMLGARLERLHLRVRGSTDGGQRKTEARFGAN